MDSLKDLSCKDAILSLASKHYPYKDISNMLYKSHGIRLSENAVGKRLKRMGVPCRKGNTAHSEDDVKHAIEVLLPDLPETVGYRSMTNILRGKGIHVRRKTVMKMMKSVDPVGVSIRRRRRINRRIYRSLGPNHIWHVDGYDKLKPYGFAIHGCIDGYSRKIMWLNAGPTNNDPAVVATNFVECVGKHKGCPLVLQADPGTENCVMGSLQCVFRTAAQDPFSGRNSFSVVRSVFNQVYGGYSVWFDECLPGYFRFICYDGHLGRRAGDSLCNALSLVETAVVETVTASLTGGLFVMTAILEGEPETVCVMPCHLSKLQWLRQSQRLLRVRIEAWWCLLRRRLAQWWIQFFRDIETAGLFHRGNELEMYCIRYSLLPFLQSELVSVVDEWNSHHVSCSRIASCPNGRPDLLHALSENSGGLDCIQFVSDDEVEWAFSVCSVPSRSGSGNFDIFAKSCYERNHRVDAFTWQGAMENYILLLNESS